MPHDSRFRGAFPAAFLALFWFIAGGCSDRPEDSPASTRSLPPLERFASTKSAIQGEAGLEALCKPGAELFESRTAVLLDDTFIDTGAWRVVNGKDGESRTFEVVDHPGCTAGRALKVTRGLPNKGRLLTHHLGKPLMACVRMRLPPGASLNAFRDLLCLLEFKQHTRENLKSLQPDVTLCVHADWQVHAEKDGWLQLFQVVVQKTRTSAILLSFNSACKGLRRGGEILVDRIMIRPATVAEAAASLVAGSEPHDKPFLQLDSKGEERKALLTATPGCLELPIHPGPERILRFGIAFPAADAAGHCGRVAIEVALQQEGREETTLHSESLVIEEQSADHPAWIERMVKVPPLTGRSLLLLRSKSGDKGQAVVAWGAPLLGLYRPAKGAAPPNIVLVSLDTLRADKLGAYGYTHPISVSPFLDSIADQSLLFEKAMAQAPYTLPSHVSMLSGQYPTVHKVLTVDFRIDPSRTPYLATLLAESGYVTGAFTGGRLMDSTFGFNQDFDTYSEIDPCRDDAIMRPLNWLKTTKEFPFFLFFHTYAVHDYAWNDPAYIDRFDPDCKSKAHGITLAWGFTDWLKYTEIPTEEDRACVNRRYAAGIRTADDGLKKLVTLLDTMGLMENTVLLITSDHGEELLERGKVQHGFTLYEELTHVPLILRPPGGTDPRRIPDLVEVIDVFPTLLEYAGLPRPEKTQGLSLIRFLDPSAETSPERSPWKETAFSEVDYQANKYALRTDTWKIIHNPAREAGGAGREFELYELASDPEEMRDLAGESQYFETLRKRVTLFRKNLEAYSTSLKGKGQRVGDLDPALLNELRAQGYVK